MEQEKEGTSFDFEFAIGYAIYDKKNDRCLEDTMKRADAAMYENKNKMKNTDTYGNTKYNKEEKQEDIPLNLAIEVVENKDEMVEDILCI